VSARLGMAQGSHKPARNRRDTAWKDRAACHGLPDEYFFPPPKVRVLDQTRRICGSCEVRKECLAYALHYSEDDGIWGGLSEAERRALKRRQKEQT
jgi:WhiB family transcriptional regulator, redox-sensing transcriptional regulator